MALMNLKQPKFSKCGSKAKRWASFVSANLQIYLKFILKE